MSARLSGSAAVVTGASSGIGRATALSLAAEGASVAVLARRKEKLAQLADEVSETGGRARVVEADVTDADQVGAAIESVVSEFGSLDIVVNSAGVGSNSPVREAEIDQWRQMVDINLMGVLHVTHAALPHLLAAAQQGRGVADVVNISSVAGRRALPHNNVYSATKHAVGAFSESLRQEVTARHVRVGVVEPGLVLTDMTESGGQAQDPRHQFEWLRPQDIADAVSYIVTRPRRTAINELMVRPTEQER